MFRGKIVIPLLALSSCFFISGCGDDHSESRDSGSITGGIGGESGATVSAGTGGVSGIQSMDGGDVDSANASGTGSGGRADVSGTTGSGGDGATSGSSDSGDEGESETSSGDANDGDGDSAGGVDPDIPLLDQPGPRVYECNVTRAAATLDFNLTEMATVMALVGNETVTYLARVDYQQQAVLWSTIGLDGTFGPVTSVAELTGERVDWFLVSEGIDRFTLVWTETGTGKDNKLRLVQVTGAGVVVTTPRDLVTSSAGLGTVNIISNGTGYAVVWAEYAADGSQSRIMLAFLDANGAVIGAPEVLVESSNTLAVGTFEPKDSGVLLGYSYLDGEWIVQFKLLDIVLSPRETSSDTSSYQLVLGDEKLIARAEQSNVGDRRQATIHLSRVDSAENPIGQDYTLQAPVVDRLDSGPSLIRWEGDIGLIWSESNAIYHCAGCSSDGWLKFVILDGDSLMPISEVMTLTAPPSTEGGGLMAPQMIRRDENLLVVSSIAYQVTSGLVSATIRCTR